jgi:hypothetical protein
MTDFKYLGSIKASDGTYTKDVKCRIGISKKRSSNPLSRKS